MGRFKEPQYQAYAVYTKGDEYYRLIVFEKNEITVYGNIIRVTRSARDKIRLMVRRMDDIDQVTKEPIFYGLHPNDIYVNRAYELDGEYRGHQIMDWNDPLDRIALVKFGWQCMAPGKEECANCSAAEVCKKAVKE